MVNGIDWHQDWETFRNGKSSDDDILFVVKAISSDDKTKPREQNRLSHTNQIWYNTAKQPVQVLTEWTSFSRISRYEICLPFYVFTVIMFRRDFRIWPLLTSNDCNNPHKSIQLLYWLRLSYILSMNFIHAWRTVGSFLASDYLS